MIKRKRYNKKVKRLVYSLLVCLTFALVSFDFSGAMAQQVTPQGEYIPEHYTDLEFKPVGEIKLPEYERYQLENGAIVYLMENHELPLVSGTALIHTGSRFEPASEVGLAELTGGVMRTGGTVQHPPDVLNQMLEQRAASVETGIGDTSGSASFGALSEDLDTVFGLFAEVLQQPAFAEDQLELAKTQMKGSIARRNDSPDAIAQREFKKLIYGENSPYARIPEYSSLSEIKRDDLVKFYQQYYYPNNMILGIEGDFDSAKMKALIEQTFGKWKANPNFKKPPLPEVSQAKTGGVFFVNQPQLTQSNVLIGHIGGKLASPDYPELDVMNGVLNGFGGRLFNEVRSRQGLAYSVYGFWSPRYDYPGIFISGGQTRSDATVQFVKAVEEEIKKIQTQLVTPQELAFAKESTLNSFVFNFQDPAQTLSRLMRYEYYGYPKDFLFTYQKQVENTTVEDVQRVAKEHLKLDKLVFLVVGNQTAINPPLTTLASQITPIDITIPATPKPQASN
ncbi:MAG: pitrilysin family protein [Rivularia sp. (in: cyanobacteria)]